MKFEIILKGEINTDKPESIEKKVAELLHSFRQSAKIYYPEMEIDVPSELIIQNTIKMEV